MPILPQKKSRKNNSPKQQFKMITFTYDTLVLFQTFTFSHSATMSLPQPKTLNYKQLILLCGLIFLILFLLTPPLTTTSQLIDFLSYFNLFFFFFVFRWFKHVTVIFFFYFWNVFNNNQYCITFVTNSWIIMNYVVYYCTIYRISVR